MRTYMSAIANAPAGSKTRKMRGARATNMGVEAGLRRSQGEGKDGAERRPQKRGSENKTPKRGVETEATREAEAGVEGRRISTRGGVTPKLRLESYRSK
jgi:hypothetical protein